MPRDNATAALVEFAKFVATGVRSGKIKAQLYMNMDPEATNWELKTLDGYAMEVIRAAMKEQS